VVGETAFGARVIFLFLDLRMLAREGNSQHLVRDSEIQSNTMDFMNQVCPFAGNSALYGIEVRIGLYAQWAATLLVTLFSPENEETFRIVNLIIQSATFLGICSQPSNVWTNPFFFGLGILDLKSHIQKTS
jgi:hypothetical protein